MTPNDVIRRPAVSLAARPPAVPDAATLKKWAADSQRLDRILNTCVICRTESGEYGAPALLPPVTREHLDEYLSHE